MAEDVGLIYLCFLFSVCCLNCLLQKVYFLFSIHYLKCLLVSGSLSNYWRFPLEASSDVPFNYQFAVPNPGCHSFWLKLSDPAPITVSILDPSHDLKVGWFLSAGWNTYSGNFSVLQPGIVRVTLFEVSPTVSEVYLGPCWAPPPPQFSGYI